MQYIHSLYTCNDTHLVAHDGTSYTKIPYTKELHEKLVYELQDPEYAKVIFDAYMHYIDPLLKEQDKAPFEQSVIETALVFGSKEHPPLKALTRTLERNGVNPNNYIEALALFVEATHIAKEPKEPNKPLKRVVILHTTASGGNSAVTRAMQAVLSSRGVECHIIDVEEYAKKHDCMQKATGYSFDELYAEVLQKKNEPNIQNGFPQFLVERQALNRKIAKYIAPTTLQKLKNSIQAIAPDLILTTRSYTFEDTHLAYALNIPLRVVYCDYHLFIHMQQAGKTDPALVKFWLPKLSSKTFSYLLAKQHSPQDSWEETARKIATHTRSTFEEIAASFQELGYPVGPEYVKIDNPLTLAALRKKWDVAPGEHLVVVTMGKNGVGVMREIFTTLAQSKPASVPVKYLFICGTNNELKAALEQQPPLEGTALARRQITGHISHQEMAEVMNICSLMLSKPGGGQAAQCQAMSVPMFVMFAHKLWESGNEEELDKLHLIYRYTQDEPLHEQIARIATTHTPTAAPSLPDWKTTLQHLLSKHFL